MLIIATTDQAPSPAVAAFLPASPGLKVEAYAPADSSAGAPVPGGVVAWAQITDAGAAGGMRLEPVFLAGGRVWTPDQYRAAYGEQLELVVVSS